MPRATKEYNSFVRGLVTEASALTYPENASLDEDNFDLNRDGSRQRRLGMDYESGSALVDIGLGSSFMDDASVKTYRWDNVNSDASLSIGIIQVYNRLWFVDLFKSSLSTNLLNSGNYITITDVGNDPISFTQVNGVAVGSNKNTELFYLSYDKTLDTITKTDINLKVRDLWGVDDELSVDDRPATLSDLHQYNLKNQGWTQTNYDAVFTGKSEYPSNSDVQVLGKDSNDDFQADTLYKQYFGNTPAPKGMYVIDAFNRSVDRATLSGAVVPVDIELGRPSTLVSYSQRVFYAGVASNISGGDNRTPNYSGFIFFTKIINTNEDLGICYQEADPTSEHIFDIIDSDGGYISIPEASNIFKLETTETSIVVMAENGVWEIFGDTGGFNATSYQVSKITNVGVASADSIVNAEGTILYWSKGGIYALTVERVSGRLVANNLTEETIQTFYNDIPSVAKATCKGSFDPASRKVSWLYNDTDDYDGSVDRNKYNRELLLDSVLQAFYPRSISSQVTNSPYVADYMPTPSFLTATHSQNVVVNGVQVQVNGEDVVATRDVRSRGASVTKYLTIKPSTSGNYKFTFSSYSNDSFTDWEADGGTGVDYSSYLITGYELFGETMRYKQIPYITFHFQRTETGFEQSGDDLVAINPSSCFVQARWEFANSSTSGKWGTAFQAYRLKRNYVPTGTNDTFDYGHEVITTKSKLRGRGRALSLYIYSEAGKDMYLLGWGSSILIGDTV